MKALYIDIETTGLIIYQARICQIGLIWDNDSFSDEKSILINPLVPIPEQASKVHKITDDMVQNAQTFSEIAPKLKTLIDKADVIIGYNIIAYDWPIIKYEFFRAGIDIEDKPFIDVYKIWNQLEKKKLKDAYKRFVGDDMSGAHDALVDIQATKKVLEGMMKSYNFNMNDCIGL